jgi:acyl-CoA thioesterase-1
METVVNGCRAGVYGPHITLIHYAAKGFAEVLFKPVAYNSRPNYTLCGEQTPGINNMPFAVKPKQTVLFTGDSITDRGRRMEFAPLGNGYVKMVSDLIKAKYPKLQIDVINTGVSGDTACHMFHRWSDDVIRHQPDWLSIMIGINDVHRWRADPTLDEFSPDGYFKYYDAVVSRAVKETKAKIILLDPFYISNDRAADSGRSLILHHLPKYHKIVASLAAQHKTRHVKLHAVFAKLLQHNPPDRFCPEPIHPHESGHLVMAYQWLSAMGW